MASYLPLAILICLQIAGGLCQCSHNPNKICPWQIAVIVLLSITLFLVLLGYVAMCICGMKKGCKQSDCCSGGIYLQNQGCQQ